MLLNQWVANDIIPGFKVRCRVIFNLFSGIGQPNIPGMPVTTPISLPGMPPITVSATLPYSTLEAIQSADPNNHKSASPVTAQ